MSVGHLWDNNERYNLNSGLTELKGLYAVNY